MFSRSVSLLICMFAVFSGSITTADDVKTTKPKIMISKATTHITSPLTKDGLVDYAAALNEFHSRGVTPQNNAVVLFYKVFGTKPGRVAKLDEFYRLLGMPRPKPGSGIDVDLGAYLRDTLKIKNSSKRFNRVLDDFGRAMNAPWKSGDLPEIAGWLKSNDNSLARLVEATKRPRYFLPIVFQDEKEREVFGWIGDLPGMSQMRSLARALNARAMLNLGEGRQEAAWRDLIACHRLGRLVGQSPLVIQRLTGIAVGGVARQADLVFLEHMQPSSKQVAGYLHDLDALAPLPELPELIDRSERYMFIDTTIIVANDSMEILAALEEPDDRIGRLLSGVTPDALDWNVALRAGNQVYDRGVEALKKPTNTSRTTALEKLGVELKPLSQNEAARHFAAEKSKPKAMGRLVGHFLAAVFLRSLSTIQLAQDHFTQKHANLRIAFALTGNKADNGGYPKSLDKLAPKYLKQVPEDLFSGKPLKYRRTKARYVLRSVGRTGKARDANRWGLGIRMPLPKPR